MELKENNCRTKGKQMWNALFLMIQFVSNRKKNEKEMDGSESNRRERLSDHQKPSSTQSKYRNTGLIRDFFLLEYVPPFLNFTTFVLRKMLNCTTPFILFWKNN